MQRFGYIVHMWTHLFTLQSLAEELNDLQKATVLEIFTQQKNELLVSVSLPNSSLAPKREQTLIISVDPKMNFLFTRNRIARSKRNSVDLFPEAINAKILQVSAHSTERLLFFELDNALRLHLQLFGTAASNVFLIDTKSTVVRAFKHSKDFKGSVLDTPAVDGKQLLNDIATFSSKLLSARSSSIYASLKSTLPLLGSTYAREALHRAHIEEMIPAHQLDHEKIQNLHSELRQIIDETRTPIVYFAENGPRVFSVIPLRHLSGMRAERFRSVNEAIRANIGRSIQSQSLQATKKELTRKLKHEHDRALNELVALREVRADGNRAAQYERIANILMANLQHLTKGTKVVELEDIFSDNKRTVHITLDPKLTPAQNAERYFDRARKARAAREAAERRETELEKKRTLLEKLLLHLDYCQTEEQVDEFKQANANLLHAWGIMPDERKEKLPFRVYPVGEQSEAWVGKTSESNDLLTMKYARPGDLWFHVRGASGSHVVLKEKGKTKPSKAEIIQAARIAAYHSKMRNASTVPVAYCERKYVRKPKRAEAGAVIMEREKVVFVEPGLP